MRWIRRVVSFEVLKFSVSGPICLINSDDSLGSSTRKRHHDQVCEGRRRAEEGEGRRRAAAYFLVLKPKSEGDPEPVAGEVVTLEPIQLNLAAGSYLRIAIALQLTAEAEEADGSRALDATIEMFSGRTVAQLSDLKQRKKLKEDLAAEVKELYDGEVMDLYITEFVTQ